MTSRLMRMLYLVLIISVLAWPAPSSADEITVPCTLNGETVPNLSIAKEKVCQYYESGQWEKETAAVCAKAEKLLEGYGKKSKDGTQNAIIFDIDDTLLCNYRMMKDRDFSFNLTIPEWGEWFQKRSAPAIKPVRNLMKKAQEKGIAIFLITGRPEAFRAITEETLKLEGYSGIKEIIFFKKPDDDYSAISYKPLERKKLTEKGYSIIMSVGDQDSDIQGEYTEHRIKIPNPMYVIH